MSALRERVLEQREARVLKGDGGRRGRVGRVGWAVLAYNLLVLARSASPPKSGGGDK